MLQPRTDDFVFWSELILQAEGHTTVEVAMNHGLIGLPSDARQIISRVGRGFGPPGAVAVAPLLSMATSIGVNVPRLLCGRG